MTRLRSQAGFTLVELSVTVAVVGILAMIAIPTFKNMMPKVRLDSATRTLSNELAMLRMSAIAKSNYYQVSFNPATDSYSLLVQATPFTATTLSAVDIQSVRYLSDLSAVSPAAISFNANGTTNVPLSKQAAFVTLATPDGTVRKRVVVETTGRIYSQKWTGGPEALSTSWVED